MFKSLHAIILLCAIMVTSCTETAKVQIADSTDQSIVCNPVDLSYAFRLDEPSRRESADPTMLNFKGEFYLFASKSGGYYHSKDMINWDIITTEDLPLEDYAPTAIVMDDAIYFMPSAGAGLKIYKSTDPKSGKWEIANDSFPIGMIDPDLFLDDDNRLYFYYGCSDVNPIYAVELDRQTLNPIGTPIEIFNSKKETQGWERKGEYNDGPLRPWIEGAWMTKYNGKYYLQYAGPGTEFKSYSDGLYVSDKPLGPFTLAPNNPVSYKPEGFVAGAGHSSTFQDNYGNYWHVSTMTISVKHMFERRLGIFPTFFDKDGDFYVYTGFGDFPYKMPTKKISGPEELETGWMLLSYKKPVEVSSEIPEFSKEFAVNEEIRDFWSAKTGDKGEWISVDLEKESTINAVQINYGENETTLFGRGPEMYYQYMLEYSSDNKTWKTLADKSQNMADTPHEFIELKTPVKARYIRLTNHRMPTGTFAIRGLRVFGSAGESAPAATEEFKVERKEDDKCIVNLTWKATPGNVGYNIRYGTAKDKLYHNYQVLGTNSLTINSLNANESYFFTIDGFNESGVTKGTELVEVQ